MFISESKSAIMTTGGKPQCIASSLLAIFPMKNKNISCRTTGSVSVRYLVRKRNGDEILLSYYSNNYTNYRRVFFLACQIFFSAQKWLQIKLCIVISSRCL